MRFNLYSRLVATWTLILASLLMFNACGDAQRSSENEYLLRLGEASISVREFTQAFERTSVDVPREAEAGADERREALLVLLNQMSEEMILQEHAQRLGVTVSEDELEAEVARIKADYPEGVFEEMLLEYAVSYSLWKERLQKRLTMDRLIDQELRAKIDITPDEIQAYYNEHFMGPQKEAGEQESEDRVHAVIVQQLRREKTEDAYKIWLEALRKKYPVEINTEQWKRIAQSAEETSAR